MSGEEAALSTLLEARGLIKLGFMGPRTKGPAPTTASWVQRTTKPGKTRFAGRSLALASVWGRSQAPS